MACAATVFLKNSCGMWCNVCDVGFNGFAARADNNAKLIR
jgi:hypothetical protein